MNTSRISVRVEITPTSDTFPCGVTELPDGRFQCIIPAQDATQVDRCEQAVLNVDYPALRQASAAHFSQASREQAKAQALDGEMWEDARPYQVDGEVGRCEFGTYWIDQPGGCVDTTASDFFAPLGRTERDRMQGFKELAMVTEVAQKSYRNTTGTLNRFRHQVEGGHLDADAPPADGTGRRSAP